MEFVKQWTMCVCASLIIAVIFSILTPKGSMKTFFKMLLSVFIFISFILPFTDFKASDFELPDTDISEMLNVDRNSSVETMINSEISTLLKSKGISGFTVTSSANYDAASGEIDVRDIQISVSDDENMKNIEKLVFDNLGLKVRVIRVGS